MVNFIARKTPDYIIDCPQYIFLVGAIQSSKFNLTRLKKNLKQTIFQVFSTLHLPLATRQQSKKDRKKPSIQVKKRKKKANKNI